MKSLLIQTRTKIKKAIPLIENKLKVRISLNKKQVVIKGNELNEFLVMQILRAVDFGFDTEDALLLLSDDYVLEFINIKEHTRRKNLEEVRGRVIGTDGKALKTIENLTGSVLVVKENMIGVIVNSEHLDTCTQALVSIIQGAKHGNVFAYLEKQNVNLGKRDSDDLGLKV